MTSTDYKQFNEEDLRQPINIIQVKQQHINQDRTDEEVKESKNEEENISAVSVPNQSKVNKKPFWFSHQIYIQSINIDQQEFRIKGQFNISWIDMDLINELNEHKNDNDDIDDIIIIPYKNLSSSIKKILPINPMKLFENIKNMTFLSEAIFTYNIKENDLFHIETNVDCTFYEYYDVKTYPFDRHFLNIKMYFNVNEYYLAYYWQQYQTKILCSLKQINNSQWIESMRPVIIFNNDTCKILKYGIISLRIKRNSKHFIFSVLLPLFILISCSFSIYSISYFNFIIRMAFLFLFFIAISLINLVSERINIPKSHEIVSFFNFYIFISYLILALMMMESIIIGLNIFKFTINKSLDIIEILFVICMALLWIWVTTNYLYQANEKNAIWWDLKARQQLTKWKKIDIAHFYGKKQK